MGYGFSQIGGFEWDAGNLTKSAGKHRVTPEEAEEMFFRDPWVVNDTRPEDGEARFAAISRTEAGRLLRVIFTIRGRKLRPISCRQASQKETKAYEKALRKRG